MLCPIATLLLSSMNAWAEPVADPIDRPAVATVLGPQSAMMSVTAAGNLLFAAGERGIILASDDEGGHWRQESVPVSVSLTGLQFISPQIGWAIGHSGVVLHTQDGGAHWIRQLDGRMAAALALQEAQADSPKHGDGEAPNAAEANARQLAADGPDKPFLDLYFADATHGYVVGAYGLIFRTDDGGTSWHSLIGHVDNKQGFNLYAIRASGNHLYLAGEQGFFARSDDDGAHFTTLPTPHQASYFAMAAIGPDTVIVAGLRGTAYRTVDSGANWQKLAVNNEHSFTSLLSDGSRVTLADETGAIWRSNDAGASFVSPIQDLHFPVTALAARPGGGLLAAGPLGVRRVPGEGHE